jgi:lysyl-tRNA synthetase class 2
MSPESRDEFSQEQQRLAKRGNYLRLRARMIQSIRRFFAENEYLEVETPYLIPAPAPEPHIDAMSSGASYLHTSPELCMKRLLAAGYSRIFQISRCFRHGERGDLHLPEFTILEWYRAGIDYMDLMEECERLISSVFSDMGGGQSIGYMGMQIGLKDRWERLSVSEAFARYADMSLERALERGSFDEVMVNQIEPNLGVTRPTFLHDYPAPLAALSRLKCDAPGFAERFEMYIAGLELANGFSELTDVKEQKERFEEQQRQRIILGKRVYPMPERFLRSLEHMPEAAGIALGVDRLAMILAGRPKIDDVVAFTPEEA